MPAARNVTDATFQREIMNSDKAILVDFWAEWCGPCRALSPVLEQVVAEHPDTIALVKLDVDDNPETASKNEIRSIPTLQVYQNGELRKTLVGAMPKAQLEEELAEFLG